jgi:hypothetical protein
LLAALQFAVSSLLASGTFCTVYFNCKRANHNENRS